MPTLGIGFGFTRSESVGPRRSADAEWRRGPRAEAALAVAVPVANRLRLQASEANEAGAAASGRALVSAWTAASPP